MKYAIKSSILIKKKINIFPLYRLYMIYTTKESAYILQTSPLLAKVRAYLNLCSVIILSQRFKKSSLKNTFTSGRFCYICNINDRIYGKKYFNEPRNLK